MKDIEFKTIEKENSAEIVEKKSRFIANIYNVESKEEAEEKIKQIKKKYYDAKHHCFAFSIIEENGITQKSSDDGEPSGTAGAPILNIIKSNNLQNVVIIVTRYFGGILLGTGGLTRAYSEAAGKVVEQSELIQKEPGMEVELEIDYNDNEKFKYYCQKNNVNIIKIEYTENILYKIELNEKEYKKIEERNKTNNKQLDINIKNIKLKCRKYVKKVG
ncbi:MAG: YigZ family protein [Clostridia bacterium]|mgnify:FL=1|jgi:YigZ family protein